MSLYPLNELKRRLDDDHTPLPKRLRLAKNVINSHNFATTPKERIVAEWLSKLMQSNKLNSNDVKYVLKWLNNTDDLTTDLKTELIKVVSKYLHGNPLEEDQDIQYLVSFLENSKITAELGSHIDDYLFISITLIQHLKNDIDSNIVICDRIFSNIVKYYRESKKKLEFIIKLLDDENLETIFSYLDTVRRDIVIKFCQSILFPITKKSYFASFLNNLIRKDNIDELIAAKGDSIQSVLKIMNVFFTFPKGRTCKNHKFLSDFITVFVSCYHAESQLVFAFYIMVVSALNMPQVYMTPATKMTPIVLSENDDLTQLNTNEIEKNDVKIKRNLFLTMLEVLHQKEVDSNVKLTDTLGEKLSKVEVKKNFMSFLQAVMMGQIKLEGKPDKASVQIIKAALKLDPTIIEQKLDQILPHLMTVKKSSSVLPTYIETLNFLLEIFFKLSRGTNFIKQILPHIKIALEASNVHQFELKQKLAECINNEVDCDKVTNKILTGNDVFPKECVEMYGKLTSELMFRQNKDLLISLQQDLEENCLMMLEEGFVSPSIITLAEVLSGILSSFFLHNKMADHTVSLHIAEEFWNTFQTFEMECLKKFGECILKLSYNPSLTVSFLKLCLSVAHLKLLNIKYSNKKLEVSGSNEHSEIFDLSLILPCLDCKQWICIADRVASEEAISILDNLLLAKVMALQLLAKSEFDDNNLSITTVKSHLIQQISSKPHLNVSDDCIAKVLFTNLDKSHYKQLAKCLVKTYISNPETDIFQRDGILTNKPLLQALVLETARLISKCFENANSLTKKLKNPDFQIISFIKEINVKTYLENMTINIENHEETITNSLEIWKQLPIHYLEENCQLTAIFVLLALKKCCKEKKIRRTIDYILQSMYELSPKYPDLYKLFPLDYIFSFDDDSIIDLLISTIKTSNTLLVVKCVLESAVKKVKTNSEIIRNIVEILLSKHKRKCSNLSSIEYFSDPVFQINCIIVPLIAKEKKVIRTSADRSILTNLQEKLNQAMLDSFKHILYDKKTSVGANYTGNNVHSVPVSDETLATLNAMAAYTLTLSICCETTNALEIKNLDCLWLGLEFFVQNAMECIANATSKSQHIESSVQLLNTILRYIKKLESHDVFKNKSEMFLSIWHCIKARLLLVFVFEDNKKKMSNNCLSEIGVTIKFLSEFSSQECFETILGFLSLEKPSKILEDENIAKSQTKANKASNFVWIHCLKANIIGPKCVKISEYLYRECKSTYTWLYEYYEDLLTGGESKTKMVVDDGIDQVKVIKVDDAICNVLRIHLDTLSEGILAAKKIRFDYKFMDAVFKLQHLVHNIMGCNSVSIRSEISWQSFFTLYEGCYSILNSMLLSREELLEDRWPCYMQCFKPLVLCLCERASSQEVLNRPVEEKLAESAHLIEKLTKLICKRKTHVSRISAYAVADFCAWLESTAPPKMVRQHLENSIALLIQASDSTYAMAFLKRALAGSAGQMTLTSMYTIYKRYHKYVGNA